LELRPSAANEFVSRTVGLPEPRKRAEWMPFPIAGVTSAAGSGNEYWSQARFGCEYFIIESDITSQEAGILVGGKAINRSIEDGIVGRQRRDHRITSASDQNDQDLEKG
jgi:hypothetical protein